MPMAKASRGNCVCLAQTTGRHIVTFILNSVNTCYHSGEDILVFGSAAWKVKTKTWRCGVSRLKAQLHVLRQDSAV
jgi:hypothetical protein